MKKPNVLMITTELDKNGDYLGFVYDWIKYLSKYCKKLNVIAIRGDKNTKFSEKNINFTIHSNNNILSRIFFLNRSILKYIKSSDIVFVHMYYPGAVIASLISKIFRKQCIYWNCIGTYKRIPLNIAFNLVDKVITCSYTVKNNFLKNLTISRDKIEVIGHGINDELFENEREKIPFKRHPILLSINRISPNKDILTTLKAVNLLKEDFPDLLLINIGKIEYYASENAKYYQFILDFINKNNLKHNVKLIERVPYHKIARFYKSCDIFISSSITGSIDKNLLEAFFSGKPAIGTEYNFKELLKDNPEFLFPKKNHVELSEKIKFILNNMDKIEKKIVSVNKKLEKIYSLDVFMERLVRSFELK